IRVDRLNQTEINHARNERLEEIHIWSMMKELLLYLCFITVLYIIIYSNRDLNSFLQVNHSRKFFFNSRITTINDYWNWLENSFVENIRAQQWYNNDPPRNLDNDEEYLHSFKKKSIFTYRQPIRVDRLNQTEINHARNERLKEIHIWSMMKELLLYLCFITVLYIIIYSNRYLNSFLQVNHSLKF
ncbi:unnamed protein product, partial [Adineta steineri]